MVFSENGAVKEAPTAPKIDQRMLITAPLRVFHIIKASDLDIQGMVGVFKQFMCGWKGKRITAKLPFTPGRVPD
ncbi:hypothetical protein PR202_ga22821 [Eleusine coracana subsp. coracana]|uniref:Ferredoxin thioredoxin reductase alpha chain domain-containing protein n=1 Tax=Eleusine coracana subsp. coracana TaxID=191504 RepID=A0AAV5D4J8_ELECO|nr:hypothetical protein PR202_ga22821 [Eleusine coracana subsp. coracana]